MDVQKRETGTLIAVISSVKLEESSRYRSGRADGRSTGVYCLEGTGEFVVGLYDHLCRASESFAIPVVQCRQCISVSTQIHYFVGNMSCYFALRG